MTSDDALAANANLTHIAKVEFQVGQAQTDAAEWEALYTAALVDLHRARKALVQIRNCEGMYEWLDKRHADGLGVTDIVWAAYVAGEALTAPPGAVSLLTELEAARKVVEAAERYLDLNSECDYVGGEPEVCPGIEEVGGPCHWCQLRTAVAAYMDEAFTDEPPRAQQGRGREG